MKFLPLAFIVGVLLSGATAQNGKQDSVEILSASEDKPRSGGYVPPPKPKIVVKLAKPRRAVEPSGDADQPQ